MGKSQITLAHNKNYLALLLLILLTGCASTTVRTVPFRVHSVPLGAYVVFQVQSDIKDDRNFDWIYLGNTPLDTRRAIFKKELKNADSFVIRVMKDGYHDQQKSWTGQQLINEAKSQGMVYWNPKLVPSQ